MNSFQDNVKAKITDLCHIDASMWTGAQLPPAVRTFIQVAYAEFLVKALDFIEEVAQDGDLGTDHLHLEEVMIDWPNYTAMATVTLDLNLAFDLVNNRLRVTGVSFG